jgi:hypothetical protein
LITIIVLVNGEEKMPYKISWYDKRTLLIELIGEISSDDFMAMTNESFALVEAASERIDAIVDQSQAKSLPLSINTLAKNIPRNKHGNQGMSILLIPKMNSIGRFAASTLLQILGLEYRIAQSMEEADAILRKIHVAP